MCFYCSGKSTLINALLNREDVEFVEGKAHNMFGSAPTGEWQTTTKTLCYVYPQRHDLQYVRL
jgi:ribosome biogenesis GTPase A